MVSLFLFAANFFEKKRTEKDYILIFLFYHFDVGYFILLQIVVVIENNWVLDFDRVCERQ